MSQNQRKMRAAVKRDRDYRKEDFSRRGERYDLIFSIGGNYPLSAYRRALRPGGTYVCVGGGLKQYTQALLLGPSLSLLGSKKMGVALPRPTQADLTYLGDLVAAGDVVPVIDRCYPLSEAPEAIRLLEAGQVRGKFVITVDPGPGDVPDWRGVCCAGLHERNVVG